MSKYIWRKNFKTSFSYESTVIQGNLAVKTQEIGWHGTSKPVIILISIDSKIHEKIDGNLKMEALVSTIKDQVNGPITVLFSDSVHFRTFSLNCKGNSDSLFKNYLKMGQEIFYRYQSYLKNFKIAYWHSYICQDNDFFLFSKIIEEAYETNQAFRALINQDAERMYTPERREKNPSANANAFIKNAKQEIMEQCACLFVLSKKGYAFQFYPGSSLPSVEYANRFFLPEDKRVNWINIFLSIEKKRSFQINEAASLKNYDTMSLPALS